MDIKMREAKLLQIDYKILEANDTHFLAPHAVCNSILTEIMCGKYDLLLGDIIDMDLCKKKEVEFASGLQDDMVDMYEDKLVTGNHSLLDFNLFVILVLPNGVRILATHGDYLFYTDEKADKYRTKDMGSGWIRRGGAKVLDKWRMNHRDPTIKDEVMERAILLMDEFNCTTLICGHSHRSEMGTKVKDGHVLQVLPKGSNEITFNPNGYIQEVVNKR